MNGPPWKHTVITTDGVTTSESWTFQGALFRGFVSFDAKAALWKGVLQWRMQELYKSATPDVEVTRETPQGARDAVVILMRDAWLKMPESSWEMPFWMERAS